MGLYSIYAVFLMIVLVSFLGFLVENVWLATTKGYVDNRNMNLPFLLGYGLAVMVIYFLLGTPENPAAWLGKNVSGEKIYAEYFICTFLLVSIGEILLGTVVEKVCGLYYWDYSKLPLHITRYTSIPTSILFGILITFFMGNCFMPLMEKFNSIENDGIMAFSVLLMAVLIVDYFAGFGYMIKHRALYVRWKIYLKENRREKIEKNM